MATHGPHHSYSSYILLSPVVPQPFLGQKCRFRANGSENSTFGPETAKKRLDLTRYMNYMNAEGSESP
jgi:hypothetical protein